MSTSLIQNKVVNIPATPITQGPGHHFFGYYDKSCWDNSGRWILALESTFMDRPPTENDTAVVGLIDTHNDNAWTPLTDTRAWNWQQGSMLQWLNGGPEIIFNDRDKAGFYARIINIETGKERRISLPVYAVNHNGTGAISLNFSRLQHQRPGYGYPGVPDQWEKENVPTDDGLYFVDLQSGNSNMILSLADAAAFEPLDTFKGKMHRFNHAQFSHNPKRFAFLHRYKTQSEEVGHTRLLTLNTDGTELYCIANDGLVSHYDWLGEDAILAWSSQPQSGDKYHFFQDKSDQVKVIGEGLLHCDGHCSFSPDRKWVLTDTYPDKDHYRTLLLYHWETGGRIDIGRFLSPPMNWEIRCDLHPRWSRDGRKICIDSIHEGSRKLYVLDVTEVVKNG